MQVSRRSLIATLVLLFGLLGGVLFMTVGGRATAAGPPHDFALFDGTNPASVDIRCGSSGPFEVMGSFRAHTNDAVMRVTFSDADFVDYPIKADTSFSFTHAAGSNQFDRKIVVTEQTGNLVGWMSASRHSGDKKVLCRTTETP